MKHAFNEGDIVIHRLTGEWVMILAKVEQTPPGYQVRRHGDYGVMAVAEFELMTQEEKEFYVNNENKYGKEEVPEEEAPEVPEEEAKDE